MCHCKILINGLAEVRRKLYSLQLNQFNKDFVKIH